MDISKIPVGQNAPWDVNVIIEIPMGGEPIKYEVDKASGALEAHDLRTRHAGQVTFIDFHLVVPSDMRVVEAHEICDRLGAERVVEPEIADRLLLVPLVGLGGVDAQEGAVQTRGVARGARRYRTHVPCPASDSHR